LLDTTFHHRIHNHGTPPEAIRCRPNRLVPQPKSGYEITFKAVLLSL
jgi:hypothetical protein